MGYLIGALVITWIIILINWKLPQRIAVVYRTEPTAEKMIAALSACEGAIGLYLDADKGDFVVGYARSGLREVGAWWGKGTTLPAALEAAIRERRAEYTSALTVAKKSYDQRTARMESNLIKLNFMLEE